MDKITRKWFDTLVEEVIQTLPEMVRNAMKEVALYVEDHPSKKLMRQLDLSDPRELYGLFIGVPLHEKESHWLGGPPRLPDRVTIFREGLLWSAHTSDDQIDVEKLKKQIRTTILHEYGHYFGMTEQELDELGYG